MSKNHTQETLDAVFSSGELHHAYLLEGGPTLVASLRQHIEDTYSITTKNNPDFHHLHVDTFTIDDARRLAEAQATRALGSTLEKFFIIEAASVTIEAQNALLKILEEPTAGTHFFFILPSRWLMLPTVLSRLQVVGTGIAGSTTASSPISAKVFLAAAPAERLTLSTNFLLLLFKLGIEHFPCFLNNFFHVVLKAKFFIFTHTAFFFARLNISPGFIAQFTKRHARLLETLLGDF